MASYRIIFHNRDGKPVAESIVEKPDDAAAFDHASAHSHPHEMQIWQGDRLVARVRPRPVNS
jgi:hypothetical protein